jgi:hypothetical protein
MILKLTKTELAIIEDRLSACDAIEECAIDTYGEKPGKIIGETAYRLWLRHTNVMPITTKVEAWVIAECVEGSTWDRLGGYDKRACNRYACQVEKLREKLNNDAEFVALLGRKVNPQGGAGDDECPLPIESDIQEVPPVQVAGPIVSLELDEKGEVAGYSW